MLYLLFFHLTSTWFYSNYSQEGHKREESFHTSFILYNYPATIHTYLVHFFFLSWTVTIISPITNVTIITALTTDTITVTVKNESEGFICVDGDAIVAFELLFSGDGEICVSMCSVAECECCKCSH